MSIIIIVCVCVCLLRKTWAQKSGRELKIVCLCVFLYVCSLQGQILSCVCVCSFTFAVCKVKYYRVCVCVFLYVCEYYCVGVCVFLYVCCLQSRQGVLKSYACSGYFALRSIGFFAYFRTQTKCMHLHKIESFIILS